MAKKHWIYIKRGLSEDPKHRAQMGECIWLYMHIIDRADWETGIAFDWKDKDEAADMSMPVDTLRRQRQKLEELDYIRCSQKQHSQDVAIMEWRNPRDYGSETKNPRNPTPEPEIEGGHEQLPSEIQGGNQGLNQGSNEGGNQVQAQVQTPTSTSIPESSSIPNGAGAPLPMDWQIGLGMKTQLLSEKEDFEAKVRDAANLIDFQCPGAGALSEAFMLARQIIIPASKVKGNRKAAREMMDMGVRAEHVREATLALIDKKLTVIDLFSVSKTAIDLANRPKTADPYAHDPAKLDAAKKAAAEIDWSIH